MKASLAAVLVLSEMLLPRGGFAEPLDSARASPEDGAEAKPKVEQHYGVKLMVLHATHGKKAIDERIGSMPELEKPPFSAYERYELLVRTELPLVRQDPKPFRLPNGRVLKTRLLEVLPDDYVRISASVNQPRGKDFLPLLEVKARVGQVFIVAGQSYKKGILVLVFRPVKAEAGER
jgi:hypothetical protein